MKQNVSQTRSIRKKADSLLVYAKFAHLGSVAPLNVILRLYTSSETQGQSGATKVFKTFVAPFISTRLTAPGFPRMGYIQLNQKRLLWSPVFGHIEECNDFLE